VALLVIWAGRRWRLDRGRAFALYAAAYTVGRGWIEALRIDEAHRFLGLRLNDWTSIVVFLAAAGYLVLRRPASEEPDPQPAIEGDADADDGRTLTA
jgi:prolipoprotein diacylglyceryltransferase